eukprot:TRINITY_DN5052_c0_g1_i1.p1 TRINITY_DN5052_c0_g1~~TRINITY_DN5052_c0_g1_i1.p1  ORF type:complete len:109 (-),score=2.75 TRINITY_DN5052_c0_g1_i1:77-403(-)
MSPICAHLAIPVIHQQVPGFADQFPIAKSALCIGPFLRMSPSLHLSISPSFHLSIFPSFHLSIFPSFHLSIFPSFHLSISPSLHLHPLVSNSPCFLFFLMYIFILDAS